MRFLTATLLSLTLLGSPAFAAGTWLLHAQTTGPAADDMTYGGARYPDEASCKAAIEHPDAKLEKDLHQLGEYVESLGGQGYTLSCQEAPQPKLED